MERLSSSMTASSFSFSLSYKFEAFPDPCPTLDWHEFTNRFIWYTDADNLFLCVFLTCAFISDFYLIHYEPALQGFKSSLHYFLTFLWKGNGLARPIKEVLSKSSPNQCTSVSILKNMNTDLCWNLDELATKNLDSHYLHVLEQLKNSKSSSDFGEQKGLNLRIGNVVMIYLELGTKDVLNLQKPIEIDFSMRKCKTLYRTEVLTPISSFWLPWQWRSIQASPSHHCNIFGLLTWGACLISKNHAATFAVSVRMGSEGRMLKKNARYQSM